MHFTKHILFAAILLLFAFTKLEAQIINNTGHRISPSNERLIIKTDTDSPPQTDKLSQRNRLYQGCSLGMTYTNGWIAELSPLIGYKFNKYFAAGGAANIRYVSSNLHTNNGALFISNSMAMGLAAFGRFNMSDEFFIHSEISAINYELPVYNNGVPQYDVNSNRPLLERRFLPALPVGLGYTSNDELSFNMVLLYDVLFSPVLNQTGSPWLFRMGLEQRF